MRLVLVRHATAVEPAAGLSDADRALTPRGRARFRRAARGLARIVKKPAALLTSPLLRARQTAQIAAAAFGDVRPTEEPALAGGDWDALQVTLDGLGNAARVVLVGHEPSLQDLLARLVASGDSQRLAFKKGGVAIVDVPGRLEDGGRLVAFLPPRALRAAGH
jgi:phosphohistidine phosphatase